jgi:predicted ABC-type ATPase
MKSKLARRINLTWSDAAREAALEARKRVEPPVSAEDVPRFLNETSQHPFSQEAESRLNQLGKETPGGNVMEWSQKKNTDENGHYTSERQAVHEANYFSKAFNPKAAVPAGQTPTAIILTGQPGSGKTSALRGLGDKITQGKEFTTINPDDAKASLPEYEGWNAGALHEESSHMAEGELADRAIKANHNIIYDITGKNAGKIQKQIETLTKLGYNVHLGNVSLPEHKSLGRVWDRFSKNAFGHKDPNSEPGRYVPLNHAAGYKEKIDKTYAALKTHPDVKRYFQVNTDVGMNEKPKLMEEGGR